MDDMQFSVVKEIEDASIIQKLLQVLSLDKIRAFLVKDIHCRQINVQTLTVPHVNQLDVDTEYIVILFNNWGEAIGSHMEQQVIT